ncbi:MAG: PepSY domain-containing protein [Paracoccaceae bacterium]
MVSIDPTQVTQSDKPDTSNRFYFAAWRWHFYAGLYVIPFFIMLATTGMVMLWLAFLVGRDGENYVVVPSDETVAVSQMATAAVQAVPGGELKQYVAPRAPDLAALFRVDVDGDATMVAVSPYTGEVLAEYPRRTGLYDLMDNIHGSLLLGVTGDRMIETAASLGMVLIASGLYMWWPRGDHNWRKALIPTFSRGRSLWKSLHGVVGFWVSIVLAFFLVSGLAWSGIWGEKLTQAWSQFPAEKWGAPLSDTTHASLNNGPKEVPWALELTPMPSSGSVAGSAGVAVGIPLTVDTMDRLAREIGFAGRYQMNLPNGETGVWTLSQDSMSNDNPNPTSDRTVHVDRYTGNILADVRYADYSVAGKAMAVGISLHMGTMGIWSVLANTLVCLSVLFLSISSIVLWWKRRPNGARRIAAPPLPRDLPLWKGAVVVCLFVAMAFPMAGLTLLAVLAIDHLIISRVPGLKSALS